MPIEMYEFDVLVIGRNCLDVIAVVDLFPIENRKTPLAFRLTEGGGQGATAACCISRLGGRPVYVGRLGDDAEGDFCRQRLEALGVETTQVETICGGRTPVAYVLVTRASGRRTIIYEPNRLPPIALTAELRELVGRAPVVMLDPETTYLARSLKGLKTGHTRFVYDGERWREGMPDMMALADYFIPSKDFLESPQLGFAHLSFVQKLVALTKRVKGRVVVTRGEDGAWYIDHGRVYHVRTPSVAVVDSTGAGDNFHAAFALGICRGFDLHGAVKLAVAVASLSCRAYGGREGIPGWEQARRVAAGLTAEPVAA